MIAAQVLVLIFKDHSYYVTNRRLALLKRRLERVHAGKPAEDAADSGMESNKDEKEDEREAQYFPQNGTVA